MIAVGVDTHKHRHTAVALDDLGQVLGELSFDACVAGYGELAVWARRLAEGRPLTFGIEGAGSWGSGLCEHLQGSGADVVEVARPSRRERRKGKSDRIDALAAARRVLAGDGTSTPRSQGPRRALAALLAAQHSAVGERTRVLNQLQSLHATAPVALREAIGEGGGEHLARRICGMRARRQFSDEERVLFAVLGDLARRSRALGADARRYEQELRERVRADHESLLEEAGIGPISAARLLVCDPARFSGEAAFARCNGTAPLPASSGKTVRHRLSRGGDRQVNNAIHTIALSRSLHDERTRAYLDRRIAEGKTKREAMRALKRHISRQLYRKLAPATPRQAQPAA